MKTKIMKKMMRPTAKEQRNGRIIKKKSHRKKSAALNPKTCHKNCWGPAQCLIAFFWVHLEWGSLWGR